MTMDRRRAMLWGLLICSTLFTTYTMWPAGGVTGTAVTRTAPGAQPAAAPAGAVAVTVPEAPPLTEAELSAWRGRSDGNRRDPFFTAAEIDAMNRPPVIEQRPNVAAPAPTAYTLKLVMMTGSEGRALIDGQVVKVGDVLGDEQVAEISPDAVVLERAGRRRRLQVATGGSSTVHIQTERTR